MITFRAARTIILVGLTLRSTRMTLVVTVNGPETIWMLADRRLTRGNAVARDDARKIACLETKDGVGLLGYAGLGATASGTEPSEWICAVLRSRNLLFERSLDVIAKAMKEQFPPHLIGLSQRAGNSHAMLVSAFVGSEARLYGIGMNVPAESGSHEFVYTRWVRQPRNAPPRLAAAGSGASYLIGNRKWMRNLLRLVKAHDSGKLADEVVAEHLAALNFETHRSISNGTVGPASIVACRHRKGGVRNGGGKHWCFTGIQRDANTSMLPTIAGGTDLRALIGAIMPEFTKSMLGWHKGEPPKELDKDEINAALARLPDKPDESLR